MRNRRLAATLGYLTLAATDTYLAGREGKAARRARYVTKPLLMPALAVSTQLATEDADGVSITLRRPAFARFDVPVVLSA